MFVCSDDQVAHNVPGIRHNGLCAFQGERERYWVCLLYTSKERPYFLKGDLLDNPDKC